MNDVIFTKNAIKDLKKFDKRDAKILVTKIARIKIPFPENLDIKKIVGSGRSYRLRVGNKRIIFEIIEQDIWITKIDFRGNVY